MPEKNEDDNPSVVDRQAAAKTLRGNLRMGASKNVKRKRKRTIEECYVYKRFDDGAVTYRNFDPKTGKTMSFYFDTGHGHIFFRSLTEKYWYHHNLNTGVKTTTYSDGTKKIEKTARSYDK